MMSRTLCLRKATRVLRSRDHSRSSVGSVSTCSQATRSAMPRRHTIATPAANRISYQSPITSHQSLITDHRSPLPAANRISHPPRQPSGGHVDGPARAGRGGVGGERAVASTVDKECERPLASPIRRVFFLATGFDADASGADGSPEEVRHSAHPAVVQRLREADAVIYGIGSLWTSICPCLVVSGVAEAISGDGDQISGEPRPKVRDITGSVGR